MHWLLLGEAQSKTLHVAGVPLAPVVAEQLHALYLAKGARATTAIEGNTLSEKEVRERLDGKLPLPPSKEYLGVEIDNVRRAFDLIDQHVLVDHPDPLCVDDLLRYNREVLDGLDVDDEVTPGAFRQHEVGVAGYKAPPYEDVPYLMGRLCDWLGTGFDPPPGYSAYGVSFALLRAIVGHVYLAWIHPFGDGNGRTARLLEYRILLEAGAPRNAAHLLSNHYNQTREAYYRELDRASKSGGDLRSFIAYALQGLVDGLREQIDVIQSEQMRVQWVNYVHERFRDHPTLARRRQRDLVLALGDLGPEGTPIPRVRYVTPELAERYAGKSEKVIQRDVTDLVRDHLARRVRGRVVANTDLVRAFLPVRRTPDA